MIRVYLKSYTSYLSTYLPRTQLLAGGAIFSGGVHWDTRCPIFAGDAIFPSGVHWGTRCPMFAGDAIFPSGVHWGTRCPMFAGDAIFPGGVHWGTRCPMLAGDAIFPSEVHWAPDAQCLQGMRYSSVKFTGHQMPNVCRGCCSPPVDCAIAENVGLLRDNLQLTVTRATVCSTSARCRCSGGPEPRV